MTLIDFITAEVHGENIIVEVTCGRGVFTVNVTPGDAMNAAANLLKAARLALDPLTRGARASSPVADSGQGGNSLPPGHRDFNPDGGNSQHGGSLQQLRPVHGGNSRQLRVVRDAAAQQDDGA